MAPRERRAPLVGRDNCQFPGSQGNSSTSGRQATGERRQNEQHTTRNGQDHAKNEGVPADGKR